MCEAGHEARDAAGCREGGLQYFTQASYRGVPRGSKKRWKASRKVLRQTRREAKLMAKKKLPFGGKKAAPFAKGGGRKKKKGGKK